MLKKFLLTLISALTFTLASAQRRITIEVYNNYFLPNQVLATKGDTIVWKWREGNHTTTSIEVPFGANGWDKKINTNSREFRYIMKEVGEYGYYCKNFGVQDNMSGFIFCAEPNSIAEYNNTFVILKPSISSSFIQIEFLNNNDADIEIYDLTGKLIQTIFINQKITSLDINAYQKGMYILKIYDKSSKKYYTEKFIKA